MTKPDSTSKVYYVDYIRKDELARTIEEAETAAEDLINESEYDNTDTVGVFKLVRAFRRISSVERVPIGPQEADF